MNAPKTNFHAWLVKAESDFLNIENNLAASRVPWDTICFHAQQAAEKILKAFLVYHARPVLRTHDLVALLAQCVAIEPSLAPLESHCRRLTHFSIAARYPDDLYEPTEQDAREMAAAAGQIRESVLTCLPR